MTDQKPDLSPVLARVNAERTKQNKPELPDVSALQAELLAKATADAIYEQDSIVINAVIAAYRAGDAETKAAIAAAAGV